MTPPAAVTVVVPTIGRDALLGRCLSSLAAADPPAAEVVVVDQSGTGAAAAQARVAGLAVRVVELEPCGVGGATNAGIRVASHDRVLVTHDDCRVAADWVGVGAALLEAHPGDLITGRVLPEAGRDHVPSTITSETPAVYRGAPRADVLYPNCMAFSARSVLAIGGFDPRVAVAEDNDLCFRWMASGGTVRYVPELTVTHGDWRTPEALRAMYRVYWTGQGEIIGKHLHRRDLRILPILRSNVAWAAMGTVRRRLRPVRRGVPDATYSGLTRLPVGVARGWLREARSPRTEELRDDGG